MVGEEEILAFFFVLLVCGLYNFPPAASLSVTMIMCCFSAFVSVNVAKTGSVAISGKENKQT